MSILKDNWIVGQPGGPSGPFHSVVTSRGRVVAMQIPESVVATLIASIPEWKETDNKLYHALLDIRGFLLENNYAAALKELNFWISIYDPGEDN